MVLSSLITLKGILGLFKELLFGRKTSVAETFGPYNFDANDTGVFVHRFKFNEKFKDSYIVNTNLYDKTGNKVNEFSTTIDLRDVG